MLQRRHDMAEKRRQEERVEAEKRQSSANKSPTAIDGTNNRSCNESPVELQQTPSANVKVPRKRGRGGGRAGSRTPSPRASSASSDDAGSALKSLYHTITKTLQVLSSRIDNLQQRQPLEMASGGVKSGKGEKKTETSSNGKSEDKKGKSKNGEKSGNKKAATASKTPTRHTSSS